MTQQQLFEMKMNLFRLQVDHYLQHEIFTWQWWLLVTMTFIPWVVWLIFRDRERQSRLLLGALIVGFISLIGDMIGTQLGLWRYGIKEIPSIPPLIPYDLSIMPVEYLLIQQLAKSNKQFIWYAILIAAMNAFLAEPVLKLIDVYKPSGWQKYYSFPVYFFIFWLTSLFVNRQHSWKPFYRDPTKSSRTE